jgi:exonuclease SbcC
MAERRAALDAALRQSSAAMRAAAVEHATEEARVAQAESMGAAMGRHMAEAAAAYAALRPAIEAAGDAAGVEVALPPVLDAAAASSLAGLGEAVLALRSGLEMTLARAAELRTEAASAAEAVETAGEVIDAGRAALDGHRARAHAAALRGENLAGRAAELADRITALEREIAPCLAASALTTADLDLDPSAVVRTIEDLVAVHRTLCDRRRDHDVRLGDLSRQRAVAAERHAAAERALTQAKAARDLRAGAWDALRHRRAGLLDGEATEAHRDHVTEIHRTASEARVRAEQATGEAATRVAAVQALRGAAQTAAARAATNLAAASAALAAACAPRPVETVRQWLALSPEIRTGLRATAEARSRAVEAAEAERATRRSDLAALRGEPEIDRSTTEAAIATAAEAIALGQRRLGAIDADLARDAAGRREALDLEAQIAERRRELATWEAVDEAIGSASGDKFRRFAQGVTLEHLIGLANDQLRTLSPRYRLARSPASDLALHVLDRDMGDELRATRSLSGGERFLVSLALALALSGLEGRQAFVDTLFIDEGFGSLDAETLDLAVDALETLQGRGRKVGVITHVAAMIERIAVQVRVEKRGNGRSVVRVVGGSG